MTSRGKAVKLRLGLAAALVLLAAPAAAQKALEKTLAQLQADAVLAAQAAARAASVINVASPCAGLPETGRVAETAPDERFAPRLSPTRAFSCPADARLDLSGRLPQCVRAGTKAVEGSPRAACYAALPLGPFADIGPRQRPTRSCPTSRLTSIVRLEGPGAGYSDVTLSVVPEAGVTATTLNNIDPNTPVDENPILQNCFAFNCRLVKLEIGNKAPDKLRLELRLPRGDAVSTEVRLTPVCPL